jgi:hypothetical protein
MLSALTIEAEKHPVQSRRCWARRGLPLQTVEEVVQDHLLSDRGFDHCIIDSSCAYGGLLWILLHDRLFHGNLSSRQPLKAAFYRAAPVFYATNQAAIEGRLEEFRLARQEVFDRQASLFLSHPLFTDPQSQVPRSSGSSVRRNLEDLRALATSSPEHDDISLIREALLSARHGLNTGWPDLIAWNRRELLFVEVKSTDKLSRPQTEWIQSHEPRYGIELIRVTHHASGTT